MIELIKANWKIVIGVIAILLLLGSVVLSISESISSKKEVQQLKMDKKEIQETLDKANEILDRQNARIDTLLNNQTKTLGSVNSNIKTRKNEEREALEAIRNSGIQLVDSTRDRLNRIIYTTYAFDTIN